MGGSRLQVSVLSARSLPSKDLNGLADPYVKFCWKGRKYKSSVQKKTLNPTWNEVFILPFDIVQGPFVLHLEIWDYDTFGSNEYMGTLQLDLTSIEPDKPPVEGWYGLQGPGVTGQLKVKLQYIPSKESTTSSTPHSSSAVTAPSKGSTYSSGPSSAPLQNIVLSSPSQAPQYDGTTPSYPSLAPPSAPPPPPPYNPKAVPPAAAGAMKRIKDILPQCSYAQISEALQANKQNEEAAIDSLLNSLLSQKKPSSSSSSPPPPPSSCSDTSYVSYCQAPTAAADSQKTVQPSYGVYAAPGYGHQQEIVQHSGRRKALLIGVNYFRSRNELRGCINDVRRMKSLLIGVYGFPDTPNTMVCLTDDNPDHRYRPTRANIMMAFRWLSADARPGDALWFHFSGHGAQQRDHTGMEEDGLDETILPCDFKHSGQIVDDEINAHIVQALPNGVRLTAVMDCCHSGTGMDLPFCWDLKRGIWEEEDNPFHVMGDVQLFSGCRDDQASADVQARYTGESGGAMSMAMVATLTESPFGHSYSSLLERVHGNIKNRGHSQRPQLTATQRFDINRRFNLTDITPNQNPRLGRQVRRTKKRKPKKGISSGAGIMMGVGGGLLTGLLLGELFD